jgi:hypothetical protein
VAHLGDIKAVAALMRASAVDIEDILAQNKPET